MDISHANRRSLFFDLPVNFFTSDFDQLFPKNRAILIYCGVLRRGYFTDLAQRRIHDRKNGFRYAALTKLLSEDKFRETSRINWFIGRYLLFMILENGTNVARHD